MFKKYIQKKLEKYVRRYFEAHPEVKLVVVTGSVGKTTTKTAIATVLSQQLRVGMENSNHNTHMSAPLAILGIEYPTKPHSVVQWLRVFRAAHLRIKKPATVDVIVQELGTDRIGEIAHFGTYLQPDIAVVTSVQPEHMEFFQTIEAVAQEELTVVNYSKLALINRDDIEGRFSNFITNSSIDTYGTTDAAEYRFETDDASPLVGYDGKLYAPELDAPIRAHVHVLGEHILRAAIVAAAVGIKLGVAAEAIAAGMGQINAVKGRMNLLRGFKESTIIDDTYNSSPAAAKAGLQSLYAINAPERIAVFGDMNELGATSADEHRKLGELCDPNLLAWVVTVGESSAQYLAPAARARGCQVKSCKTALEAGAFVHSVLEEGSAILMKGSQGNIYLEEAVKIILHDTHDDHDLVRQTPEWLRVKKQFFSKFL